MISKKDISFIQPSRDNLVYLKWSYDSIRKNGGVEPHICVADDFSSDGTWEWCTEMMKKDKNFHAIRNEGPTRLGHTILYDKLVNEVAPTIIVGIYHADMYLCPGSLESVIEHLKPQTVVSLTRIEPDLHPPGPEKALIKDAPQEPTDFDEGWFLNHFKNEYLTKYKGKTTEGIFAPWFLFKEDFQSIGGHDPLYAPQSKEDSDIFNRFLLNGYKFVQTWDGAVFHLTCRGSRFNPTITTVGTESDEWLTQNIRSTRNFIRKWGHFVKHDTFMKPIVPPKYEFGFNITNSNEVILNMLEPWCSKINVDLSTEVIDDYIKLEQPNTMYVLSNRINDNIEADITVTFDANKLTQSSFNLITEFASILESSELSLGEFELDIFKFNIRKIKTYENSLIRLN